MSPVLEFSSELQNRHLGTVCPWHFALGFVHRTVARGLGLLSPLLKAARPPGPAPRFVRLSGPANDAQAR